MPVSYVLQITQNYDIVFINTLRHSSVLAPYILRITTLCQGSVIDSCMLRKTQNYDIVFVAAYIMPNRHHTKQQEQMKIEIPIKNNQRFSTICVKVLRLSPIPIIIFKWFAKKNPRSDAVTYILLTYMHMLNSHIWLLQIWKWRMCMYDNWN